MRRTGDTPQPGLQWRDPGRVGFFQYALGARRMSTAGFPKPARRQRLQVATKALTKWIITKEGRAGVRFKQDGFEREARTVSHSFSGQYRVATNLGTLRIGDGERLRSVASGRARSAGCGRELRPLRRAFLLPC